MSDDIAGAEVSGQDIIAATDYVAPSLEILDTRIKRIDPATGKTRTVFDTIADNAANAGVVLGAEKHTLRILICAGLVPLFIVTAKLRKQAWVQAS